MKKERKTKKKNLKTKFINKRVRHKCEDPNCPITGRVISVKRMLDVTRKGRKIHILWALVECDAHGNIPEGYRQYVPLKRIKIIEEKETD